MTNWIKKLYKSLLHPVYSNIRNFEKDIYRNSSRQILQSSTLWDEKYYMRCYCRQVIPSQLDPLDHYIYIGWKEGCNPSAAFDGKGYLAHYPEVTTNPLIHFLAAGRFQVYFAFWENKYPATQETIERYLEAKAKRGKAEKAVYACITNSYDDLNEIAAHYYVDPDWDYICFSDNEELLRKKQLGVWEIRPLLFTGLNNVRNARYHKIMAHKVLADYKATLYADANVSILTPYVFDCIRERKRSFLMPYHSCTTCLYQELDWILTQGWDPDKVLAFREKIQQEGFPENLGFTETNVMYRDHQDPKLQAVLEDWWYCVENYSHRDQGSFMYAMWKNGFSVEPDFFLNNTRIDYDSFCVFRHICER